MDTLSPQDADINSPIGRSPVPKQAHPNVWLLMGHKAGDNTQVLALAEALGWPYEIKRFVYKKTELLSNLLLGPTLAGIRKSTSARLIPPWPDLLITAGRRNEPIARWIQKQSNTRTRIVHIGRPWAQLHYFDLIITTPQYLLPQADNILHNTLPLHRVTASRLEKEAAIWAEKFTHLPRPYIVVLMGGNSGPFTLSEIKTRVLAQAADTMARAAGGSLLITTSARTPSHTIDMLQNSITSPAYCHRWSPDNKDNPYFAYLDIADSIIVTGDSVSMLSEACETRKPVYIFDLSDTPQAHRPSTPGDKRSWWCYGYNYRFRPLSHRLAMWLGPQRMRRDVYHLHERLTQTSRAAWLGDEFPGNNSPPLEDLPRAVQRVKALFPFHNLPHMSQPAESAFNHVQ